MDYDGKFIMQKTFDRSLLNDGMTIPVSACSQQNYHRMVLRLKLYEHLKV